MTSRDPGTMSLTERREEIAALLATGYRRLQILDREAEKAVDEVAEAEAQCARG